MVRRRAGSAHLHRSVPCPPAVLGAIRDASRQGARPVLGAGGHRSVWCGAAPHHVLGRAGRGRVGVIGVFRARRRVLGRFVEPGRREGGQVLGPGGIRAAWWAGRRPWRGWGVVRSAWAGSPPLHVWYGDGRGRHTFTGVFRARLRFWGRSVTPAVRERAQFWGREVIGVSGAGLPRTTYSDGLGGGGWASSECFVHAGGSWGGSWSQAAGRAARSWGRGASEQPGGRGGARGGGGGWSAVPGRGLPPSTYGTATGGVGTPSPECSVPACGSGGDP